jgi:hypothetical protein
MRFFWLNSSVFVESRVKLPACDVPSDLTVDTQDPPEVAEEVAEQLRVSWGLDQEPIPKYRPTA